MLVSLFRTVDYFLRSIRPNDFSDDDPVFPSPKGRLINYNNFCNTPWNRIVDPIKPGTTPYCCRDTAMGDAGVGQEALWILDADHIYLRQH